MHVNFKAEWKKRADLVEEGLLRELKKVPAYDDTASWRAANACAPCS